MRKLYFILIIPVLAISFSAVNVFTGSLEEDLFPKVNHHSFSKGEELNYRVNYGMFSIGEAKIEIEHKLHKVNLRDSYKLDVYGKTKGFTGWVIDVDDQWGVYLDTASLLPHISYRNIKEGKYRKNEIVRFDHKSKNIEIKVLDQKKGSYKKPEYFYYPIIPDREIQVRDILGGYMYLRTLDFKKINPGDTVILSGFFEDTFYDLQMTFRGRETVKTRAGKFKAIKLTPVVPENELFNGRDSVVAWFSDDDNKMPLRIEAKMFVGSVFIELTDYKGLRNKPALLP
jgi:hypothetical protein